jgi:hypothetical protein
LPSGQAGDAPEGQPKQLSAFSYFKPVATEEDRAAQQARDEAAVQRFAEQVQRQKQKQAREAQEKTMSKRGPGRPSKLSKMSQSTGSSTWHSCD